MLNISITDASSEYEYSRSLRLWTGPGTELYTESGNVPVHVFERA